jgi:nucleoid DNA-binding protein
MDELVKLVSSKVGISEAQAKQAVDTVLGFLKEQLPEPIAKQVDAAIKGDLSGLGDLAGGLGGLFGKK